MENICSVVSKNFRGFIWIIFWAVHSAPLVSLELCANLSTFVTYLVDEAVMGGVKPQVLWPYENYFALDQWRSYK
jgi:hypothetical protein